MKDGEVTTLYKENDDYDVDLPTEVIERVNIGVIAVSLSMYDEGMSIEELAEVTGIKKEKVKEVLEFLVNKKMVKRGLNSNIYRVINFKKLLRYLVKNGLVFPLKDEE